MISGGNDLVGKSLSRALLEEGHRVSHLSRTLSVIPGVTTCGWNVVDQQVEARCLDGVDTIIRRVPTLPLRPGHPPASRRLAAAVPNLSGSSTAMGQQPHVVKSVISTSGIAFYRDRADKTLTG